MHESFLPPAEGQVAGQATQGFIGQFKAANLESVSFGEVFRRRCVKSDFI